MTNNITITLKGREGGYTFDQCFADMFPVLCTYAEKYVDDADLAKDIVQDTFMKLSEVFADFDTEVALRAYLYRAVRNATINHLEHLKVADKYTQRKLTELHAPEGFLHQIIEKETHRIIYQAIEALPARRKEIILLSINGLTNPEIAKKLDISVNTIKTQKTEAYKQLRESLRNVYTLLASLILP